MFSPRAFVWIIEMFLDIYMHKDWRVFHKSFGFQIFLVIYFQSIPTFDGNQFLSCIVPSCNKFCMLLTSIGTFERHISRQKALKNFFIKPYYIENFKIVMLFVTTSIINSAKAVYHLKRNNRSKKKSRTPS